MAFSKWMACVVVALTAVAGTHARNVPRGWSVRRRADPDAFIPLKFALAQSNVHNLDAYLLDVADPRSPNYGNYWSPAAVADAFRPSDAAIDTVRAWLAEELGGAERVALAPKGDAIRVNATVAEAERVLGAEYFVYAHDASGAQRVGCHGGYTLPPHVAEHVDLVWPTVQFSDGAIAARPAAPFGKRAVGSPLAGHEGVAKAPISEAQLAASGCDKAVTLDCLRALYNFDHEIVAGDQNTVSVFELQGESFRQSDLDKFFTMFAPDQVGNHPTLESIEGGTVTTSGDFGEATLDISLMMGLLGANQELLLYQIGDQNAQQDPLDEFVAAFDSSFCDLEAVSNENLTDCGDKPVASVVSISYHLNPDIHEDDITPVIQRQCTEFGKLALAGMTIVVSSGDGGVAYSQSHGCLVANGTLVFGNPSNSSFVAQFPASCPYVTAVGATQVTAGNSVDDPETATTAFPSGAGFSNTFAMPSFQEAAVSNYVTNFAPAYGPTVFNRSGRAYPDVSANGFPTVIIEGGSTVLTGGTSASAPIFASFVAAINDARIAAGKGPVGFINPALYSDAFADAFNDITNGTNAGCGTEGFPAAPGWDPITGLGTPNFPNLLAAFMALP